MDNNLTEALNILKRLSIKGVEAALKNLREIEADEKSDISIIDNCPHCGSVAIVRNGRKHKKQAYLCRGCSKSFVETTGTAYFQSHFGEAVWEKVIRDTINGESIDDTANDLGIHHETVFNMRHKILYCLEQEERENPTKFEGICEMDETYILESYKGKKLPDDYWRAPRNHKSNATKSGLSNEYICICAGVEREGQALAMSVNRATAGSEDIRRVFGDRIDGKTVVIADGSKGYGVLEEAGKCAVLNAKEAAEHGAGEFFNINTVNSYHSFIKGRNRNARGFATKYINRYSTLFSKVFRPDGVIIDNIYRIMHHQKHDGLTIERTQTENLLEI